MPQWPDASLPPAVRRGRPLVDANAVVVLDSAWETASAPPDARPVPLGIDDLDWMPARVPGTVAAALAATGRWRPGEPLDLDGEDWWFRTAFDAPPAVDGEEVLLRLDGLATVAEIFLNGERVASVGSMYAPAVADVGGQLRERNELAIRCRALSPLLAGRRRPRARWRTKLVAEPNLRFIRTTLLGRAPGFAPGPAPVGPWRPVMLERRRVVAVDRIGLRCVADGDAAIIEASALLRSLGRAIDGVEVSASWEGGAVQGSLETVLEPGGIRASGTLRIPGAPRWWPHTHGDPELIDVRLMIRAGSDEAVVECGRVGLRDLETVVPGGDLERDGIALRINGVPVFARGAVWTPADPIGFEPGGAALDAALDRVADAGMNMLRIPGIGVYESDEFHDGCDERGILVWQDLMFANLDYPFAEPAFAETARAETTSVLARVAGRPSLAVVCGNSEVEQQVSMLGLDPTLGRGEFFGETVPALMREAGTDAAYVPSAPCGGDLPFRTNRGIANYYGVGGYRRPLWDARLAEVRFAAECLAFANVPDAEALDDIAPGTPSALVVHHPRWKAGVPRDNGSGWDFEDVRDHYLKDVFGVEPQELRRVDHDRYLELSRSVTGEVMARVFGEWRRADSPCNGGLILWLRDLRPGAGWGVLDHRGEPKAAYYHLRRALAPVAVWMTDEGLNGIGVHVANDRAEPLQAALRVGLFRDFEVRVEEATVEIDVPPHGRSVRSLEEMLGHFVDASWSYRFGPAGHDVIVATLEAPGDHGMIVLSQAARITTGYPLEILSAEQLGLQAQVAVAPDGGARVAIRSRRFVQCVRLHAAGFRAEDDAFSLEPGGERVVSLVPRSRGRRLENLVVTATNLRGRMRAEPRERSG